MLDLRAQLARAGEDAATHAAVMRGKDSEIMKMTRSMQAAELARDMTREELASTAAELKVCRALTGTCTETLMKLVNQGLTCASSEGWMDRSFVLVQTSLAVSSVCLSIMCMLCMSHVIMIVESQRTCKRRPEVIAYFE